MFHLKYLFYFLLLHLIIAAPQMNLYYTDGIRESDNTLQHNCLYVLINSGVRDYNHMVHYCMSELPSKFSIENNDLFPNFTFAELSKQNISSEQLYLWSVPIDVVERYQFYLNQLSTSNDLPLATEVFYNCTLPRFGPMCQYEFYYNHPPSSSLPKIIDDFYVYHVHNPTNFTCYMHLQCNRGPHPACLDWSEICDGKIDCLDGGSDEEHCWELEINECKDNEYRCRNGQCISESFYQSAFGGRECIDGSDEKESPENMRQICTRYKLPIFDCEDTTCTYSLLTSSCTAEREYLLAKTMYSSKDSSVSEECWRALVCIFKVPVSTESFCRNLCANNTCIKTIKTNCSEMLYFPAVPLFFGDVYLAFRKNNSQHLSINDTGLLYVCYNNSRYDTFFSIPSMVSFNHTMCFLHPTVSYLSEWSYSGRAKYDQPVRQLRDELKRYHLPFSYTSTICNRSNMYQCVHSSKCVSVHHLMDNVYDCPHMDDENITEINNTAAREQIKKTHYKCQTSNKYIHQSLVKNGFCDCKEITSGWCDDEPLRPFDFQRNISFQTICDGSVELLPVIINGQNETDETECEQWQCDNVYTRCDGIWNCPNGADESSCASYSTLNCFSNHHLCVSPQTNNFICLPIQKANDGIVNCLGGTDEPVVCQSKKNPFLYENKFHCINYTSQLCLDPSKLCNKYNDCENGDDEQFCEKNRTRFGDGMIHPGYCSLTGSIYLSDVESFLCKRIYKEIKRSAIFFKLQEMENSIEDQVKNTEKTLSSDSSIIPTADEGELRCHRGLDIRVWLNEKNKSTRRTCLCPPSYYGDRCQYQNQRISLTVKFRALSDSWQTLFAIVISLIDDSDQHLAHSHIQFSYLWMKNCNTKFELYLLYSIRPKNSTKQYSVHIDFYEKVSLNYRGSVLFPVTFPFLPVHRLAFFVDIPRTDDKTQSCTNDRCVHGKCIRYSNNPEQGTFCQCNQGWTGRYCNIQHSCMCASDSLCIGVSANNRSICVCRLNKFGSRCLLTNTICQSNDNNSTCYNGGQCISSDDYMILQQKFMCVCPKGFSGDRCEIAENKLILSFDKNIVLSPSIFIHFIQVLEASSPQRLTTFRTIPDTQNSVIIYWSQPFHLVFIELANKNYYLIVAKKTYTPSSTIVEMMNPSDRCPHIHELFNQTFVQWHLLRRIKHYHLPCQKPSLNLSCFYDDVHLCLCYTFGGKRLANCFEFNHTMTFNCYGQSECENDAQCFQDSSECSQKSMCVCPSCYYGRRCQFSTSGFGLSLDAILGYHIRPNASITQQPSIVQFSLAMTIILIVAGLTDSILSMITFKNKSVREVGCGLYLLCSSITTLLTIIIFGLKFFILLLAQMSIISNRSFLQVQCHSIDFLLRVCLCMDQWLNACVAVERTVIAIIATRFNKKRSRQAAKIVIVILLVIIVGTCIHDPIHRRMIEEKHNEDDNDDSVKRMWCTITYPYSLRMFNSYMHTFHFLGPFIINLLSAIILIIEKSQQQATIHKQRAYQEILRQQIQEHKHLLIAPIVLVILALPRLIITFVSKCMKSTNDSWLFLIGYFISFIPTMLTFVVFVLPSKFYKKEFRKTVEQYRTNIQRRLHLIS